MFVGGRKGFVVVVFHGFPKVNGFGNFDDVVILRLY